MIKRMNRTFNQNFRQIGLWPSMKLVSAFAYIHNCILIFTGVLCKAINGKLGKCSRSPGLPEVRSALSCKTCLVPSQAMWHILQGLWIQKLQKLAILRITFEMNQIERVIIRNMLEVILQKISIEFLVCTFNSRDHQGSAAKVKWTITFSWQPVTTRGCL